jgi:hypothetical protein
MKISKKSITFSITMHTTRVLGAGDYQMARDFAFSVMAPSTRGILLTGMHRIRKDISSSRMEQSIGDR